MKILYLFIVILPIFSYAQGKQRWVYDFDQCSLAEQNLLSPDISSNINPNCVCGLEQEGIELNNQSLSFPVDLDTAFYGDFSLGFSVMIEPGTGNLDLFSKMSICNADTAMSIIYQSNDSSFVCSFQQGFDKIVQLVGKADPNSCWQQVMIVRSAGLFRLFINGEVKHEIGTGFVVRLNNKQPLRMNASPCLFVNRTRGILDQFILSNFAFNSTEVRNELIIQDEILTQDTLIFKGASFLLRAKADCANAVNWSPASGLSSTIVLNPNASPTSETRYKLQIQNRFCMAEDEVLVKVIDTSLSDCSQLRLPTAFSPNDDRINDVFFISNNYLIEKLHYFDILDRNGALITRMTNPKDSWDGNWNGQRLNPGSFYYRIAYNCKGQDYKLKGSFFLMR